MHIRLTNLLGAFALGLSDRIRQTTDLAASLGAMAPAAIVNIVDYPGETIDSLSKTLALSHSATVRLVDRLQREGLLKRKRGADGRSICLIPSARGRRTAASIIAARRAVIANSISGLNRAECESLETILEKVLGVLTTSRPHADTLCRLCELSACPQDRCPVEVAARSIAPSGDL